MFNSISKQTVVTRLLAVQPEITLRRLRLRVAALLGRLLDASEQRKIVIPSIRSAENKRKKDHMGSVVKRWRNREAQMYDIAVWLCGMPSMQRSPLISAT